MTCLGPLFSSSTSYSAVCAILHSLCVKKVSRMKKKKDRRKKNLPMTQETSTKTSLRPIFCVLLVIHPCTFHPCPVLVVLLVVLSG